MNPITTMIVCALAAGGARVAVALLGLRWRSREEHARQSSLVALADRMPGGSRLVETRSDGSRLRLSVGTRNDKDNLHG
jgi:hypothetical protein